MKQHHFFFIFVLALTLPHAQTLIKMMRQCSACICEATTGCDTSLTKCDSGYNAVCGPLRITKPYWEGAGKPTIPGDDPSSDSAFENCVTDLFCGAKTIHMQFNNTEIDCNADGRIDCDDYLMIHLYGRDCYKPEIYGSTEWKRYMHCKLLVNGIGPKVGSGGGNSNVNVSLGINVDTI